MTIAGPRLRACACNSARGLSFGFRLFLVLLAGKAIGADYPELRIPAIGEHSLQIISPRLAELTLINSKQPNPATVDSWNWVNGLGQFNPPDMSSVRVIVNGQSNSIVAAGFKRRPIYAPQGSWNLRIANHLYLQLAEDIPEGASVTVINNGTLWPTNMSFAATTDPLRFCPAIHVNQEGYLPAFPKKAIVGYYLGNMGELPLLTNRFFVVNIQTGATVFDGILTQRSDVGYTYAPAPYQQVFEADFSGVAVPGIYRIVVPGMGGSLPFRIDEGIGMMFARTYALGMFHQRSGFDVAMPFTRFTHAPDHIQPATVPTNFSAPFAFTWLLVSNNAVEVNTANPPQSAPRLTGPSAQLFPFVDQGPLEVSGGHFEAGDYNRVTYNAAQVVHLLMFAVDSINGVAALDNLGIPESGDGISDILQEAKWEADFLAKMQDADGGFYYSVYPQFREYEFDVLPEHGDPQVVWPKNTATTAAAVAALAQCASSPRFRQAYPSTADMYWSKAQLGWAFLTNAIAVHGLDGAYQRLQHFGDHYTDRDDLAWAATELFLATGDPLYQQKLFEWFPDPTDPATFRWGWWRLFVCYGNAIRSYASAVNSGRLQPGQINAAYLAKCVNVITNCGNDNLLWSQENAYGTSFPRATKEVRGAGWYFSTEQAFDIVVAHQFNPNPAYVDAVIRNINFEAGCNPLNQPYITGLGWSRQREIVDQYSNNDHRKLPKSGFPIGNLQRGFVWTFTYGFELGPLCFPSDDSDFAPYPFYDRWCDMFNVMTEASTTTAARGLAAVAWLAGQTSLASQPWRSTNAIILSPATSKHPGKPVTVELQVADTNLAGARIVWEARDQEPAFGGLSYTFSPSTHEGTHWIEAEVSWPDGRRAFAIGSIPVSTNSPPELIDPGLPGNVFSFRLVGKPHGTYVVQSSTDFASWIPVSTNTLPANGETQINQPAPAGPSRKFYRAVSR